MQPGFGQIIKPFEPKSSNQSPAKKIYNINGDFTMIGNTSLTLKNYSIDFQNNLPMVYVDVDDDPDTFNSSSATLQFSKENGAQASCTNVLFAGLYWTGRSSPQMNFQVEKSGVSKTLDKREVKIKGPGSTEYALVRANSNEIWYPESLQEQDGMFVGYAEITDLVREFGEGEYTVADLALLEGEGGPIGYYGGWGMVIVYENHLMKQRDIVVFDGYAYVASYLNTDYTLDLSGFSAVESGQVNLKMGMIVGEGDRGGTGDYFEIERGVNSGDFIRLSHDGNEPFNFFNATITTGGNPRNPELVNNTGLDIAMFPIPNENNSTIANGQTSTRFRYGSTIDTYTIFNITFAIEADRPEIEGINRLMSGQEEQDDKYPIDPGERMDLKLEIRNRGSENIIDGKIVIPVPVTALFEEATMELFFEPNNAQAPYFDPDIGAGGALVWEIGDVPVPSDPDVLLAVMDYSLVAADNCSAFVGFQCDPSVLIHGEISGINGFSGVPFSGIKLIQGYENAGDCNSSPITDPLAFSLEAEGLSGEGCSAQSNGVELNFCNYGEDEIPLSEANAYFPPGTRYFNEFPFDFQSVEYTVSSPFPKEDGTVEYFAVLSGENNCFQKFTITHRSMVALPTVTSNYKGSNVSCHGANDGAVFALVEGGIPPYTFLWDDPLASTSQSLENLSAGTYTVTVTDSESCVATASVTIEQPEPLDIVLNQNNSNLELACNDSREGKITFEATGGSIPIRVDLIQILENGTEELANEFDFRINRNLEFNGLNGGSYILKITDTNECVFEMPVEITAPAPIRLSSSLTEADNCLLPDTGVIEVIADGGVAPYTYSWSNGTNTPKIENLKEGIYTVTVYDASGCSIDQTFEIQSPDPLESYVTSSTEVICGSRGVTGTFYLTLAGGVPPYTINWDGGLVQDGGLVMVADDPGDYSVTVTDDKGCILSETVTVLPIPLQAQFEYLSTSFDDYSSNLLNYSISFFPETAGEIDSYEWDFGDGNTSTEREPDHTYTTEGEFNVRLTVTDIYGCKAVAEKSILIDTFFIQVPNAFTPDGDGMNDYFFPAYNYLESLELWVFNKWGETIYNTNDKNSEGWDGTFRGQEVPAGNYVYKLIYETPDGSSKEMTNVFILIR